VNGHVALATGLALLTASLYACSNVLKLLEAEQVPSEYAMKLGLLARLVRRPRWLIGIGCDACVSRAVEFRPEPVGLRFSAPPRERCSA